jgi:hypothetical protein
MAASILIVAISVSIDRRRHHRRGIKTEQNPERTHGVDLALADRARRLQSIPHSSGAPISASAEWSKQKSSAARRAAAALGFAGWSPPASRVGPQATTTYAERRFRSVPRQPGHLRRPIAPLEARFLSHGPRFTEGNASDRPPRRRRSRCRQ